MTQEPPNHWTTIYRNKLCVSIGILRGSCYCKFLKISLNKEDRFNKAFCFDRALTEYRFFCYLVVKVHEQERGPKHGLQGDSDGLRRGGSNEDHPSGDTASSVAALWGSGPASIHSSLQGHAGFGIDHGMGLHGAFGRSNSGGSRGALHAPPAKRTGGGIQIGEHTGFLRMRGLPFSAAKEDIFKFFVGYNPILDSIVLTYRNDGRATGEAYIGFASPEDAERAMALHRRSMGTRYIELFISNKDEQGRALARFGSR